MKIFIVLSALVAVGLAKPSIVATPVAYAAAAPLAYASPLAYAKLVPGAPIGLDGRVVDTPEVSYAKAEHAAAHINEKLNLAREAVKSADYVAYAAAPAVAVAAAAPAPIATLTKYTAGGAPIGLDGRVVDTPEVAYAKAEHAAAHINDKFERAKESLKSADYVAYASAAPAAIAATPIAAAAPATIAAPLLPTTYAAAAPAALTLTKYTAGGAPIGLDGRVVDTPEVAYAKAEHAAARINEKIEQGQEILRNSLYNSPVVISSSYIAPAYATGYIQHYY